MRRAEPNLPAERVKVLAKKREKSIEAKCHPAIFEIAQLHKELIEALKALPVGSPQEVIATIETRMDKRLKEIEQKYSGPIPPAPNTFTAQIIFSDAALRADSDAQGIAESMHFERHRIPAKVDVERRARKDWNATRRLLRTTSDLEQLRCGKGPIQAFKGNLDHSTMFQTLWGFGIEKLGPEELADFFDRFCPCSCEGHSADALKNQRARFRSLFPPGN